jgi:iturin family lipopeptide synthetase C
MEDKNIDKSKQLTIAAGEFFQEKEYWKKKLSGEFERVYFPYDFGQPGTDQNTIEVVTFRISGELSQRMTVISGGSYAKLHMLLVAGVAALLARYTGSKDITVGTAIDRQDVDGMLINTILPLRIPFSPHITFKELLMDVREVINEAIENQNYPIETLLTELELAFDPDLCHKNQFPLFDVVVLLENLQDKKYVQHLPTSVTFSFQDTPAGIEGQVEYNSARYRKTSIKRMVDGFLRLLGSSLFDIHLEIKDIELLSPADKQELIVFNSTSAQYPHQELIQGLFARQVEETPHHIALVEENGESITYRQLNQRAHQWAKFLLNQDIKPCGIIGLLMERSIEMVCALLAILKAGCAFLPIDLDYPRERKQYILDDSQASLLIVPRDFSENLKWPGKILHIEDLYGSPRETAAPGEGIAPVKVSNSDLAYIIYTSGSTGKPKGVVVENRALVNYTWWAAKTYVKNETVSFPFYTSIAFDLTLTSLFTPLVTGNTIFIYRGDNEREFLLERIVKENEVDIVKLTPVHLLLMNDWLGSGLKIKRFIVGGEKLDTQLARKIHDNFNGNVEIYNEYGPTEATVGCMIYQFNPQKDTGVSVPIGSPADNVQIYLLDEYMREVPPGGTGEIYIGGDSLARGYLNKPDLTAEKFIEIKVKVEVEKKGDPREQIPNPKSQIPNKHMSHMSYIYKTGDMARRLANGNIEFLGRKDQQVKIKGYRIETGEVENHLLKHRQIHQAAVLARYDKDGYSYLVAYIVPMKTVKQNTPDERGSDDQREIAIDPGELREYLSGRLPEFMIPSYFVSLDQLPVTPNGKINRKSLPEPGKNVLDTGVQYQPPGNELEKTMVAIWQEVLSVDRVGLDDSYFSLGGDSIKAIQISGRLHNHNLKIDISDLFRYPTIGQLSSHVKSFKDIANQGIIQGEARLTPIQHWFFQLDLTEMHHFNQSVMLYRRQGFNREIVEKVFHKILEHHDALRMVYFRKDRQFKQVNRGMDQESVDLKVYELTEASPEKIIKEKCNQIQASIDLGSGPLMKTGLFKTIEGDYLLIVIHHLVIDGLSWRILFEDFTLLYQQIEKGVEEENFEIPFKTTSYK